MNLNSVLFIALLIAAPLLLSAQSPDQEHLPCGTPPGISPWLEQFTADGISYDRSADTLIMLPLGVHVVGRDDGSGYLAEQDVIDALCQLNEDFSASNIRCYIKGGINYINDSDFYDHDDVIDGAFKMFDYNIPNAINCYIMGDPAGNCGYNLNYAGIALKKNCIDPGDHTWVHEVAHHLTIQHTFLGWEGGITHDGSQPANYSQPAPEKVTYDYTKFKNQLYLDTLIIDTALVEKTSGADCAGAADRFCDTPPDYLAFRWPCDANGFSLQTQVDPEGNTFKSDGSFFISYAFDQCQSRFSDGQIAAMRANLTDEKDFLLENAPAVMDIDLASSLLIPEEGQTVSPLETTLSWSSSPNAEKYVVELDIVTFFGSPYYQSWVTTDTFVIADLIEEAPYYWRVRPFNNQSFCTPYTTGSFFTGLVSSTSAPTAEAQPIIQPNPVKSGEDLRITLPEQTPPVLSVSLYSLTGQKLVASNFSKDDTSASTLRVSTGMLTPGMYIVSIQTDSGLWSQKVMVQ